MSTTLSVTKTKKNDDIDQDMISDQDIQAWLSTRKGNVLCESDPTHIRLIELSKVIEAKEKGWISQEECKPIIKEVEKEKVDSKNLKKTKDG